MTSTAAAPSFSGQALPAVTVPSGLNDRLQRGELLHRRAGPRAVVLRDLGAVGRGARETISLSKWPLSRASTARFCEMTAHSSCASRLTLQRSATFSAVRPIGM